MQLQLERANCLDKLKELNNNSIDLIVTDPPYKLTKRGRCGNTGGMLATRESLQGKLFEHVDINNKSWIKECYRVLKDESHFYLMTNQKNMLEFIATAQDAGFIYQKALIWDKGNKITGTCYMNSFEFILFFRKGKFKKINKCGTADILRIPNKKTKINGKNIHNSEKPIELMKILIENSSNENDVVLDPFMGAGSTILAALELNRKAIGFEIDRKYFDLAQKRIYNY